MSRTIGRTRPTTAPVLTEPRTCPPPQQTSATVLPRTVVATPRRPISNHLTNAGSGSRTNESSCIGSHGGDTGNRPTAAGRGPAHIGICVDASCASPPHPPAMPQMAQTIEHSSHFLKRRLGATTFDIQTNTLANRMCSDRSRLCEALDLAYNSTVALGKSASDMAENCRGGQRIDGREVKAYCQGNIDGARQTSGQILEVKMAVVRQRELNMALAHELAKNAKEYVCRDVPESDNPTNYRSSAGYITRAEQHAHHVPLPGNVQSLCPQKLHGVYRWYAHQIAEGQSACMKDFMTSNFGGRLVKQTSKILATAYYKRAREDASDIASQATAYTKGPSYHTQRIDLNHTPRDCTNRYSSMVSSTSNLGERDPKAPKPPYSTNLEMNRILHTVAGC
jgi:hypothetical protein